MKLSYSLAFSITNAVVILAIGYVFRTTYIIMNPHDDPNTPNTQESPDSHSEFVLPKQNLLVSDIAIPFRMQLHEAYLFN